MRGRALLASVLLLVSLVPASGPAVGDGRDPVQIRVDRTVSGVDTYMISIQVGPDVNGLEDFEISPGSWFRVEGNYAEGTDGSLPQDAATIRGVVRYETHTDCSPDGEASPNPCFMDAYAESIKDASDADVRAGPVGFEKDPNASGWRSMESEIVWDEPARFEFPDAAESMRVRIFAAVPGAQSLDVDVQIRSPQPIQIEETVVHDGGFLANGEEFGPTARIDTAPANAMVSGETHIDLEEEGHLLYAAFGPSWNGTAIVGPRQLDPEGAGVSTLIYDPPPRGGDRAGGTAIGAGSFSGFLVTGAIHKGSHSFQVLGNAGAGAQDIYLVGFKGPV